MQSYKVITSQDLDSLMREVDGYLHKGWVVSGNLVQGQHSNGLKFWAQPIVKEY